MSRILITGAAGGIGAETSKLLTDEGHHVIAADVRADALANVTAAEHLVLDITDPKSVQEVVTAAEPVEILINTVGQGVWSPVEVTPFEQVRTTFELNAIGPIWVMQAALAHMRRAGAGTVINLTSASARLVTPLTGLYAAPKAALDFATRTVRFETAKLGIKVMVIEPQFVGTGFVDRRYYAESSDPYYSELIETCVDALGRLTSTPIEPIEVAKLIAGLLELDDPGYRWAISSTAAAALADGPVDDPAERETQANILGAFGLA